MSQGISDLFEIYRATEIHPKTRIRLLKKMGQAINYSYGANVCEPIVYELVLLLDPGDDIKTDEHYTRYAV